MSENNSSTARTYRLRVPVYENEEGIQLLREIARQRGCSVTAAVRQMIREEACRVGLLTPASLEKPRGNTAPGAEEAPKPFWRRAQEIASAIPQEERERFPEDGAEQLDHYVYGVPKRPPQER